LDPFLQKLTKEYTDDADLSRRLMNYFYEMDTDGSGLMTFSELSHQFDALLLLSLRASSTTFYETRNPMPVTSAQAS